METKKYRLIGLLTMLIAIVTASSGLWLIKVCRISQEVQVDVFAIGSGIGYLLLALAIIHA